LNEVEEKVTVAYSGKECLETLKKKEIDVVILDIKMPGMDGIETLREIKKRFPLVEVIMLTGHGSTETAVEGMKMGAFDYLMKPADFDDLTAKMEAARKRKEEQEERIRKAESKLLLRKSGGIF
jgi:DNA-binding NtrC family response regulator